MKELLLKLRFIREDLGLIEKTQFLLNVWSKKESAFKRDGVGAFNPSKIDVTKYNYFESEALL